jgi:Fe-S-cluster containining protein
MRAGSEHTAPAAPERACGACSLCCTVLRVDELAKLAGTPCVHQRPEGGCGVHPRRPAICRRYRCLWLQGGLEQDDRPDRLGAVLDLASRGGFPELVVHEASPGAFERSPRLREIAQRYRLAMPVRILDSACVLDPDRPFRVLLPGGEEQRVAGERIEIWRDGVRVAEQRMPWLERLARRAALAARRLRLRRHRRGPRAAPGAAP